MVVTIFHCFAVFPWTSGAMQSENEQFRVDEKSHRSHCNCAAWSCQCCGHGEYSSGHSFTLIAFLPGNEVYSTLQHTSVLGHRIVETDKIRAFHYLRKLVHNFNFYDIESSGKLFVISGKINVWKEVVVTYFNTSLLGNFSNFVLFY
jgi:hypothetical protein